MLNSQVAEVKPLIAASCICHAEHRFVFTQTGRHNQCEGTGQPTEFHQDSCLQDGNSLFPVLVPHTLLEDCGHDQESGRASTMECRGLAHYAGSPAESQPKSRR